MNTNDIIKIDTKLLLRFLKENNLLQKYFIKNNKKFNSYDKWYEFIIKNKKDYMICYSYLMRQKAYNELICMNKNLINSQKLFSALYDKPFVLNDYYLEYEFSLFNHEENAWNEILNNFIVFKTLYFNLKLHEKY